MAFILAGCAVGTDASANRQAAPVATNETAPEPQAEDSPTTETAPEPRTFAASDEAAAYIASVPADQAAAESCDAIFQGVNYERLSAIRLPLGVMEAINAVAMEEGATNFPSSAERAAENDPVGTEYIVCVHKIPDDALFDPGKTTLEVIWSDGTWNSFAIY